MKSYFEVAEFVNFWFAHGKPPVTVFPLESNIAQLIAFLSVLIFPIVNLYFLLRSDNVKGKSHIIGLSLLIYFCFYMVLEAGMFIEYATAEEISRSLHKDYYTPIRILLYLSFTGSCGLVLIDNIHRIFHEKRMSIFNLSILFIFSFICIGSSAILFNYVKVIVFRNEPVRMNVKDDDTAILNQQSNRKVKIITTKQQLRSRDDIKAMLKQYNFYDIDMNPSGHFENDFKDPGDGTITDLVTGLVWEKSGSEELISFDKVKNYVDDLNRKQHLGYSDWVLPHVDELASLLVPVKTRESRIDPSVGLFMDPLFDRSQSWCWTADRLSPNEAWVVYFYSGSVGGWPFVHGMDGFECYVRVVRHVQ